MSSMRNAVQRRNHKERAQPAERGKWGLLEKHQDYSLRARDYNAKKTRLKVLRSKAAERNPDEFHYGMLSSRSKGGRKIADRGNPVLSHDAVKLLKTQDSGYLRTMLQQTLRQIERLEEGFVFASDRENIESQPLGIGGERGRQIVYVDDVSSQRRVSDPGHGFISEELSESMDENGPQVRRQMSLKQTGNKVQAPKNYALLPKGQIKVQEARRAKLIALMTREKDLRNAGNELETQRARMSNVVGGVNRAGVKFKIRERKR